MSRKARALAWFWGITLVVGSAISTHAAPASLCQGPLWDLRFGEAVVGTWGLTYANSTVVFVNGQRQNISAITKAEQLSVLQGCSAFCICDANGTITTIDIVAPQNSAEVGSIWQVTAEREAVRPGSTVTLEMRAPQGGKAHFAVTGVERDIVAKEVQPGVYRALWTVPEVPLRQGRVLGQWQKDATTWYRWGAALDIVTAPPQIEQYGPQDIAAEADTVELFARAEAGTAIETQQMRIWVNEREVTGRAQRLGTTLYCPLPAQECPEGALVCVKISDKCGQSAKKYWRVSRR